MAFAAFLCFCDTLKIKPPPNETDSGSNLAERNKESGGCERPKCVQAGVESTRGHGPLHAHARLLRLNWSVSGRYDTSCLQGHGMGAIVYLANVAYDGVGHDADDLGR